MYVAEKGNSDIVGVSLGGSGKGPKKFLKNVLKIFFEKEYEMCVENMSKRRE